MRFVRLFLVIALCLFTGIAKADIYGPPGSASDIETNTTNFDNNLSIADTDVQKALDTLDAMVGGSGAPTTATYLTSTANTTLTNEVDLGALSSGFLYGTVAGGISTISSIGTAAVTNGAATLSTGDQIYDFVVGQGYLTSLTGALLATGGTTGATSQAQAFTNGIIAGNNSPTGDFTLTQNSVVPFTSIFTGAIANTLYLKAGNVGIGTTDLDGTPAIGRLTIKGSTNDGSTNILVGRDSDEANVFSINTNGQILSDNLTASEILITDASKNIVSAPVATYPSLTELSYVKGLSSAVQTQLGTKAPSTAPTFATSITGSYLTASEILVTDADKKIVSAPVATYPSLTELSYVKGLSSAIQTQLGTKAATATTITVAGTANQITSSTGAQDLSTNRTWTLSLPADVLIPTILTTPNTGLHLLDTNVSHDLIIKPGSDLTADKTLTITTGDADKIIDLTAVTDEYVLAYDTGTNTWRGVVASSGAVTYSKSFLITNPTSAADSPTWEAPVATTITAVHLLCVGGTNVVGQLWEYDGNGANGAVVDSTDITGTAGTTANDDGTLSNPSIDAGDWVGWKTTSVSGSPTKALVTYDYQNT